MLTNILGIHKDSDTWSDPEAFDPWYRLCPGENLARKEVFSIFVKLLQGFRVTANSELLPSLEIGYNNLIHAPLPYMVTLEFRTPVEI